MVKGNFKCLCGKQYTYFKAFEKHIAKNENCKNISNADGEIKEIKEKKVKKNKIKRIIINYNNQDIKFIIKLINEKVKYYQENINLNVIKESNFIYGPEQSCKSPTIILDILDKLCHKRLSSITILANYTEHLKQLKDNIINKVKKVIELKVEDIPSTIYEGKDNKSKLKVLNKKIDEYLNDIIITSADKDFKKRVKEVSNDNPKIILSIAYWRHLNFLSSTIYDKVKNNSFQYNLIIDEIQSNMNEAIVYEQQELQQLGIIIEEKKRKKKYNVSRNREIMKLLDCSYKRLFVSATPMGSEFIFKDYVEGCNIQQLIIPEMYISHKVFNYYNINGNITDGKKTKTFNNFKGCEEWYDYLIENYNPRNGATSHIITVAKVGNCREHIKMMISGFNKDGTPYKYYNVKYDELFNSRRTIIVLYDKMAGKREVWRNGRPINIPYETKEDKKEKKSLSYILHQYLVENPCRVLIYGYDMFKEGMSVFSKRYEENGKIIDGIGPSTQWMKAEENSSKKSIENIRQMSGRLCQTTGRTDLVFACSIELEERIKSYKPMLDHLHNYQKKTGTNGFENCGITNSMRNNIGMVNKELKLNGRRPKVFKTKRLLDFKIEVRKCKPDVKEVKEEKKIIIEEKKRPIEENNFTKLKLLKYKIKNYPHTRQWKTITEWRIITGLCGYTINNYHQTMCRLINKNFLELKLNSSPKKVRIKI